MQVSYSVPTDWPEVQKAPSVGVMSTQDGRHHLGKDCQYCGTFRLRILTTSRKRVHCHLLWQPVLSTSVPGIVLSSNGRTPKEQTPHLP